MVIISNYQPLDTFLRTRKNSQISTINRFPNDTELQLGGIRKLRAAILVFDIAQSSSFSNDEFIEYLSPFLHMIFHVTNQMKGVVDKYTGDGAMISFCDENETDQWACESALSLALTFPNILNELIENRKFKKFSIRIGIEFGEIFVDRIGVRGITQYIIIGSSAITAKRLETIGKSQSPINYITICIGHDFYHNLTLENKKLFKKITKNTKKMRKFFGNKKSIYGDKSPYIIYEYKG